MGRNQMNMPPLKENLTELMIGPLLAVLRELGPFLLEPTREPGSTPTADKLDGGVESAAAATFLRTCARLDSILEDAPRWNLKGHNALVNEMVKTHKYQQRFIAIQSASAEMLQSPSYLLRPTLAIAGPDYIAWWGNITVAGEAIIGRGKTPNDALADFDLAFDRTPQEQLVVIAEKQGVELPKQPPTQ